MLYEMKSIRLIVLLALPALAGCFSLGRDEPPQRHYVLGASLPEETGSPSQRLGGLSLGLRQVQLAEYLQTPLIVVRHGPHQIRFSEFNRWGEDLGSGVNRAVAGYLAGREPVQSVDRVPWPRGARHDYLIQVQVLRFEGLAPEDPAAFEISAAPEGEAHLLATWEIIGRPDDAVLARGTTEYRVRGWTVGDYDGLVILLDAGLQELSDDLVAGLKGLIAP